MNDRVVKVQIKSVYGNERIYPRNPAGQMLCDLTKKTTLSRADIEVIKALGFTVEVLSEVEAL